MIPRRDLGPGYTIPPAIIGGWQLSEGHSGQRPARDTLFSFWDRLLDRGFDTFDCADIYTGVEALLGEYHRSRMARALSLPQIHTKFVPDLADLATLRRGDVARIIERSLRRLGVERLDLVQFHWWDFSRGNFLDGLGWLDDLRREGKIRSLALTNVDRDHFGRAVATGIPLAALQVQYSVLDQRPGRGLDRDATANRTSLLCYGALAGGFLADRWLGAGEPAKDANRSETKYRLVIEDGGGWGRLQAVLEALGRVGRRHGVGVSSAALRWVLDRPAVAAVVVGLTTPSHLDALEAAVHLRLDEQDHAAITAAAGPDPGPPGDVYQAERVPGGRHARIMRYDLNARAADPSTT